eukprot:CAMPEP_0117508364 /NCGR_PEP_ID=MMETSP0784-20121206/26911_1 /TAXON_ID=39447 /ORGANISM="" /LENGTH=457 /DNA_ID=CAMNT_0005303917 /DNA_START=45 /DNA_END=1418 /DNA_ORIENTATION=+
MAETHRDGCADASNCSGRETARDASRDADLPTASFYFAGAATLLGWNVVLTFTHTFDCDVFGGMVWAGSSWPFWSTLSYSLALNIVQGIMSSRTLVDRLPFGTRWCISCVSLSAGLLGLLLCAACDAGRCREWDFAVALLCVAFLGSAAAVFQSAAFGMAGAISPCLTQTLMVGQGVAGVFCGMVGILVDLIQVSSKISTAFGLISSSFFMMLGVPLWLRKVRKNVHVREKLDEAAKVLLSHHAATTDDVPLSLRERDAPQNGVTSGSFALSSDGTRRRTLPRRRSSVEILRRDAWPQALTVFLVFAATFAVFPGVTSRWLPAGHVTSLIATFQLLDVVGRMAPKLRMLRIEHGPTVTALAFGRLVFVPLFIMLEQSSGYEWARGVLVQFAAMVVFAFTNGYVSTLSMMLGSAQRGVGPDDQEVTGSLMSLFLVGGIFVGSMLALPTQIGVVAVLEC